jgi:hypothetical protein
MPEKLTQRQVKLDEVYFMKELIEKKKKTILEIVDNKKKAEE